jgi:hypothetical protein
MKLRPVEITQLIWERLLVMLTVELAALRASEPTALT